MAINYQRRTLVPPADVGVPSGLPLELRGLTDASLADLPLAIGIEAATQLGYLNTGFVAVIYPPLPPPPVINPLVGNGAFRVALRRAGLRVQFQNAVNALGNEYRDWYDHQPGFALGDFFTTAVVAQAGGALPGAIAGIFTVAASANPA